MTIVRTLLRLLIGAVFIGHGGQKLLGWFGGEGLRGTVEEMETFRLTPARPLAATAAGSEFGAGLMLVTGFLQPLGCALGCSTMLTAIWSACLPNGFFVRDGGLEYPLVLAARHARPRRRGPRADLGRPGSRPRASRQSPSRWAAWRSRPPARPACTWSAIPGWPISALDRAAGAVTVHRTRVFAGLFAGTTTGT